MDSHETSSFNAESCKPFSWTRWVMPCSKPTLGSVELLSTFGRRQKRLEIFDVNARQEVSELTTLKTRYQKANI